MVKFELPIRMEKKGDLGDFEIHGFVSPMLFCPLFGGSDLHFVLLLF